MFATTTSSNELNVSLEPHLADTLNEVVPLLPDSLSSELKPILAKAPPTPHETEADVAETTALIPYTLLSSISAWARSSEGLASLRDHNLASGAYSMVALLAGTRTSPERKFPQADTSSSQSQADSSRELNDRRAVTAVLNALLSILGSGVAVWWAADRLRWKDEWKVLLALLAAIVVAASEAVLFLIWDSRRSRRRQQPPSRTVRRLHNRAVKDGVGEDMPVARSAEEDKQEQSVVFQTPASTNVQAYQTTGGLRERAPGYRRSKEAAGGGEKAS